ncbi:MAG: FAD-binding protein [Thaumarchaeota archaeon]|nr:FAD-binding protein [Nitrososphaerota archaeon]MCL5318328.1 FAD-binding protein [Nitrososphaerota archaeon]
MSQQHRNNVATDLKELVSGEVLDEEWQRSLYAADASIYETLPLCVVIPRSEQDVVRTVRYAYQNQVSITARGGGTALAGQTIGNGITIDFSKYLNRVLEVNAEKSYVMVEPGINKSELDLYLKASGKFFPPDPSSSDFCTIGGMIANNSSGPHTVKYGSVIDYIISLRVVLSNGDVIETKPVKIGSDEWHRITSADTLEAKIYRDISKTVQENGSLIEKRTPKVRKNCSGYRLERLLHKDVLDLSSVFAASEGTLGVVLQAKLRIVDIPRFKGTAMLQFDTLEKMGKAVAKVLETKPSAVELLDDHVVDLASSIQPELRKDIAEDAKAFLLVEYDGPESSDVEKGLKQLDSAVVKNSGLVLQAGFAYDSSTAEKYWALRKKSLPYVMKLRREGKRPTPFIEDVVVQPEQLALFIQKLYEIYQKYDVEGVVYGHAGDGQLHTRPLLNLKREGDRDLMRKIADEVFQTVIESGGSITGEHGDGLVRAQYVQKMFGDDLYQIFKEVKCAFDPRAVLNPGRKIVEDPGAWLQNLRYDNSGLGRWVSPTLNWGIKGSRLRKNLTGFSDELSYEDEVELCHGCGTCRELTPGRMCPVFKTYRGETDSCRGRLSVLRWLLKVDGLTAEFEDTEQYRDVVFDHCVQCKMCLVECPSNVNVGKLMAEARARYSTKHGSPPGYSFFADIDRYAKMASRFAPISNRLMGNNTFRKILERSSGIDQQRPFPRFSWRTFAQRFHGSSKATAQSKSKSVVFFYDTFVNYLRPDLGLLLVKILERNGYAVLAPPQRSSGLSALIEGNPAVGKEIAEYNVSRLAPYAEKGVPIVTFSPSAGVALKLEYLNVLDTPAARSVADSTLDIHEFLYSLHRRGELDEGFKPVEKSVYLHLHCHDRVQRIEGDVTGLLGLLPSLKFEVLEKGCCGIGGAFGFVKGHYRRSLEIGEPLLQAVRSADREVYSTGESCAMQIEAGSGRKIGLTVELLGEAYSLLS